MRISAEHLIFNMSTEHPAVASCSPGESVVFETMDCFSNQICSVEDSVEALDFERINPATGPLEIKGARPGDILKIFIEKIKIADKGVMVAIPDAGALQEFVSKSETKIIPIMDGEAVFNEKIQLKVHPMIGVIGVAPAESAVPCGTPDSHGGNMDSKIITEGAILYLPVQVAGGLLAMGDMHAVMADGEVVVCGVEIAGEVTVKIDLISDRSLSDPMVETVEAYYTIASAKTLDKAAQKATDNMFSFLKERLPLSNNEIAMLMSIICDLQISQIVDPAKTARMRISKEDLAAYQLEV